MDGCSLERATARLGGSEACAVWLSAQGLGHAFARRWGIGLESEDDEGVVLLHRAGRRTGEPFLSRLRVTRTGAMVPVAAGEPGTHWTDPPAAGTDLLVLPDMPSLWRLEEALGDDGLGGFAAVARLHRHGIPVEWGDPHCWAGLSRVVLLVDDPSAERELVAALAAAGPRTFVARPPVGGAWAEALRTLAPWDASMLDEVVGAARPLADVVGAGGGGRLKAHEPVEPLGWDGSGCLLRFLQVEEREVRTEQAGRRVERARVRDLVVSSNGRLLDVQRPPAPPGTPPSARLVSLSDGTRLTRWPPTGARARWSLGSATAFVMAVERPDPEAEGAELVRDVEAHLMALAGLAGASARPVALFVLSTYVHQGLARLPMPMFVGGGLGDRLRAMRALAELCHACMVVGRTRARQLALLADATGGTILLDEPGPLAGPSGPTEIGRFLAASVMAGMAVEYAVDAAGRRPLLTFGPRAVFSARPPTAEVEGAFVVDLTGSAAPATGPDLARVRETVDRLYCWAMTAFAALRAGGPDLGPVLGALAGYAIGGGDGGEGDVVIPAAGPFPVPGSGRAPRSPREIMENAFDFCVGSGRRELAMTHLLLEAALLGGTGEEFSPERVGRWLVSTGRVDAEAGSTRRRLHGHICRLYIVAGAGDYAEGWAPDGLTFCTANQCSECRYTGVCGTVTAGLQLSKNGTTG